MGNRKKKKAKDGRIARLFQDMDNWCEGRMWLPRALLLALFAFIACRHAIDPQFQDIFKGLNLGIHEMGHYLFAPCGEFMAVAGGSLLQCLVPIGSMLMFLRQRDYFAIAVAWGWLGTNLYDVAVYAGDSISMSLPLVSPGAGGGEIIHDWNWLLTQTHLLNYTTLIATLFRVSATICMAICLCLGSWLCFSMMQSAKRQTQINT